MRAHSMRNSNPILHGDQTRCEEKKLQGRPRMLTRDLYLLFATCVCKLLRTSQAKA